MGIGYAPSPYGGLYGYAAPCPESGYTLDSGDRLRVVVFGQDGLTNSYVVDAGGNIDMPLIGAVGGARPDHRSAGRRIADKLRDGYIREPHVAVEVEAYRPFFILGEVTQPGQYPYVANMTAETAVAIAGGFTPRASRKSVIADPQLLRPADAHRGAAELSAAARRHGQRARALVLKNHSQHASETILRRPSRLHPRVGRLRGFARPSR